MTLIAIESSWMDKWQFQLIGFRDFHSSTWDFFPPYPSQSETWRYLTLFLHNPQTLILLSFQCKFEARNEKAIPCGCVPNSHTPKAPSCSSPESPCPSSCDEMPRVAFLPEEGRGTDTESTFNLEIQMINVSVLVYSPLEHRDIYRKSFC